MTKDKNMTKINPIKQPLEFYRSKRFEFGVLTIFASTLMEFFLLVIR